MWNSNIKLDLLSEKMAQAIDNYCLRGDENVFNNVIGDIKKHFRLFQKRVLGKL